MAPQISQAQNSQNPWSIEYGLMMGSFLPDQIDGVTEIQPFWGGRFGWSTGMRSSIELRALNSTAKGTKYNIGSISFRSELPSELMALMVYGGLDAHYYSISTNEDFNSTGGVHVGAALTTLLGDILYFRTDMRFNFNPGVGLFIGFGFVVREF